MKNLLFLAGILLSINSFAQSHIFENNKETTFENGEWGRWTVTSTDIGITTEINGIYKISFYNMGEGHAALALRVKFSNMEGDWFKYIGNEWIYQGEMNNKPFEIKTNVKLSQLSTGRTYSLEGNVMYIFLPSASVGYILSDY